MKIRLLLTGKTKVSYLNEGLDEYVKRIRRYVPFELEVMNEKKARKLDDAPLVRRLEGEQVLKRIRPEDYVILLDERGESYSSEDFARYLEGLEGRTSNLDFIVGGAFGFSDEVYQRASSLLSLSRMTFSHQMVRLIFLEQLYRAFTILRGEPYHHK